MKLDDHLDIPVLISIVRLLCLLVAVCWLLVCKLTPTWDSSVAQLQVHLPPLLALAL